MRGLSVRRARPPEMGEVAKLIREVFRGYDAYYATLGLRRARTLVAEVCGALVGFAEVYVTEVLGSRVGVIYYIGVKPGFRRRGVGRALEAEAARWFARRGCSYSMASTVRSNVASRAFFRRLGYREVFLEELFDALGSRAWLVIDALYAYEDDVFFLKALSERRGARGLLARLVRGTERDDKA
ncbi:MAG: hypothetical protein DRJ56_00350 [Thermoprotei archaeon]|nr:MAG: hypothetical protein DRJ56_00350 [Thermoprotei archaeon]